MSNEPGKRVPLLAYPLFFMALISFLGMVSHAIGFGTPKPDAVLGTIGYHGSATVFAVSLVGLVLLTRD